LQNKILKNNGQGLGIRNTFRQIADYLRMIKFSHTVFALPFALAALLIIFVRYRHLVDLTPLKAALIVVAFTGMRSFAMAINRVADRAIDAQNPRTANREIPAGKLGVRAVVVFAFLSLAILTLSAYFLTPLAGYLALPAAAIVAGYSYAKRFTWLCHFWLGAAIGMAPLAVYAALLQSITPEAWLMAATLCFYIAGFDILYSLQDRVFDKARNLHSVPARFGISGAMWISRISHLGALATVAVLIYALRLSFVAWGFFPILAGLLMAEHLLVGSPDNPRYEKIPIAFFHINTVFSAVFLAAIAVGLFLY
jgi:4-hydroxybenzoate polyprenyltransferase